MVDWSIVGWGLIFLVGLTALYGMHRLGLWLEDRGHIYYLHKKPTGSSSGSFVALQRAVEPQSQHVFEVRREKDRHDLEEAQGGRDDISTLA